MSFEIPVNRLYALLQVICSYEMSPMNKIFRTERFSQLLINVNSKLSLNSTTVCDVSNYEEE